MIIKVDIHGDMEYIYSQEMEDMEEEGEITTRRASHIEPVNPLLRLLFHAVRALEPDRPGNTGPLAAWTRRWRCRWRVNLKPSGGPIINWFNTRAEAIEEEVRWLTRRRS